MPKFKATKDGILSDPYKRVEAGDVVIVDDKIGKSASWLVPVEDYKPDPEMPIVPHMDINQPKPPQTNEVPPAPSGTNYQNQMEDIVAKEGAEDGLAAPATVTEVEPGKFVGEAVPVDPSAPADPVTEDQTSQAAGTGNQDVIA